MYAVYRYPATSNKLTYMLLMKKKLAIVILAFKAATTIWKLENSSSQHLLNTLFLSKFGI